MSGWGLGRITDLYSAGAYLMADSLLELIVNGESEFLSSSIS